MPDFYNVRYFKSLLFTGTKMFDQKNPKKYKT